VTGFRRLVTPALSRGLPSLQATQKAGGSRVKPGMTTSVLCALLGACSDHSAPGNDVNYVADNVVLAETDTPDVVANEATPPFAEVNGAHPYAPEPAPVPSKFRGTWAESKTACTDLNHPSRLTISGRTARYPTFVIFGDEVTVPTDNQVAIKGKIEGTDRAAEAHFSIDATGNTLTDEAGGGAVRVRCA
jgi:hypothetical protein